MIERRESQRRDNLRLAVKVFFLVLLLLMFYAFTDYTFNSGRPLVAKSYRFELPVLEPDMPQIFRRDDGMAIVVIRRSEQTLAMLNEGSGTLDPNSELSEQPTFAKNPQRSREPEYFVGLAIGTDYGCPLVTDKAVLRETCSNAHYDFAGRALKAGRDYRNLSVPDYRFADDHAYVTITLQ